MSWTQKLLAKIESTRSWMEPIDAFLLVVSSTWSVVVQVPAHLSSAINNHGSVLIFFPSWRRRKEEERKRGPSSSSKKPSVLSGTNSQDKKGLNESRAAAWTGLSLRSSQICCFLYIFIFILRFSFSFSLLLPFAVSSIPFSSAWSSVTPSDFLRWISWRHTLVFLFFFYFQLYFFFLTFPDQSTW